MFGRFGVQHLFLVGVLMRPSSLAVVVVAFLSVFAFVASSSLMRMFSLVLFVAVVWCCALTLVFFFRARLIWVVCFVAFVAVVVGVPLLFVGGLSVFGSFVVLSMIVVLFWRWSLVRLLV